MSDMSVNAVLSQMRAVRLQAVENLRDPSADVRRAGGDDFAALMRQAIDGVNAVQRQSRDLAARFESGDRDVELSQVMIADQKASLAFTAATQVRNKLVTAYQDIMNMPM